ncbi:endonuclease VII domain-containing protein [Microtetraspora malaysiensis]|uniref:endonuclease VII domain-containing protein n=1 Tax=Microtetraspora malaysiensis TaxID=161358 RepID=UPI003D8A1F5F
MDSSISKACTVDGCDRPRISSLHCRLHHDRFKRTGSTDDPYPEVIERTCIDCKVIKPAAEFSKKGKGKWGQQKYQSYCKPCENERKRARPLTRDQEERQKEYRREWGRQNREKRTQQMAARRAANPERYSWQSYKNHLWKKYRLSWDEYEQIFVKQGGRCAICDQFLSDPRKRPAIDHDHETGVIRGLLCDPCNKGLGHFRDRLDVMRRAVTYLENAKSKTVPIYRYEFMQTKRNCGQ